MKREDKIERREERGPEQETNWTVVACGNANQGTTASWWHPDRAYVRVVPSVQAKAIPSKTTRPLIAPTRISTVHDGERVA